MRSDLRYCAHPYLARLVSIHDGHVAIHEDEVVRQTAIPGGRGALRVTWLAVGVEEALEALGTVPRDLDAVAHVLKHRPHHLRLKDHQKLNVSECNHVYPLNVGFKLVVLGVTPPC